MKDTIEERAVAIADEYGVVDDRGCVDVIRLVLDLGGEVEVAYDNAEHPESLQVRGVGDFTVLVPFNTSHARDRFTVAHELAHYFLHYEGSEPRSFFRYGRGRQEAEANAFAAALLMPAEYFRSAWADYAGDLAAIARHFGVSYSAAAVRAQVLSLK